MPGWNADWTTGAVKSVKAVVTDKSPATTSAAAIGGDAVQCDEWAEHSVLVVQRDTFANFFHDSEDFVNVFLALAILQWRPGNTQVLLTDLYPKGPFWYAIHGSEVVVTSHDLLSLYLCK
jgi:hypothetical protein